MFYFRHDVKVLKTKHLPIQNIQTAFRHMIMEGYKTLRKSYDDHGLFGDLQGCRDLRVEDLKDLILLYDH